MLLLLNGTICCCLLLLAVSCLSFVASILGNDLYFCDLRFCSCGTHDRRVDTTGPARSPGVVTLSIATFTLWARSSFLSLARETVEVDS